MEMTDDIINDTHVVHLRGKLTIDKAPDFFAHMESLIGKGEKNYLVEMSDLGFIDSTGLGTLIRISKRINEAECRLRFSNLQPKVLKMIELTRLDKILSIYTTQEEALKD